MVDLLQAASQGSAFVAPTELTRAADQCLQKMIDAGWSDHLTKKFHWLLHFGDELRRHGKLVGCFAMERKHKAIRTFATAIQDTRDYELKVYREVLGQELYNLSHCESSQLGMGLQQPGKPTRRVHPLLKQVFQLGDRDMEHCLVSSVVRLGSGGSCSKGDVVLVKPAASGRPWDAGQVWLHVEVHGVCWTLVSMWQFLSLDPGTDSACWVEQEQPLFVQTNDILSAVMYTRARDGIRTLIPYPQRQK